MKPPSFLKKFSGKTLIVFAGIAIAFAILFFIWQKNKYRFVGEKLKKTIASETDSLYRIKYDSLHFDEVLGTAYLKNVHVTPDTLSIRKMKIDDMPVFFLDIKISSIAVTGVQTDKALTGKYLIGDSVIINNPRVQVFFARPISKETKVDIEAKKLYEKILGDMKLIKVGYLIIKNAQVNGTNFFTSDKDFSCVDANIELKDILIDSVHNYDTTRTLFCKEADVNIRSFDTYNQNIREFAFSNINFNGAGNVLKIENVKANRISDTDSSKLVEAEHLSLQGLDANEFVKNKNIVVSKVACQSIDFFEAKQVKAQRSRPDDIKTEDSTGFSHSYSIALKLLQFPSIKYIQQPGSKFKIGKVGLTINEVISPELINVQQQPFEYSKEVEIRCNKVLLNSKSNDYTSSLNDIIINTRRKNLRIGSFNIKPHLGEADFASKSEYQRDRYDVSLSGIELKGINLENLLNEKVIADELVVKKTTALIYRSLEKPLKKESKVGNYPSQLLKRIDLPIDITKATFYNTLVEYKEKEKLSDSTGKVQFDNTLLTVDNITNISSSLKENDQLKISFRTKALGSIPVRGTFQFRINDTAGNFIAKGSVQSFDADLLNKIAIPMALVRINTGTIDDINFEFKGDNLGAGGPMVMKYHDFKVDVLKKDEESNEVKKKGLMSLFANIIIINNNPRNGELRKVEPYYKRDINKSFFNLVWKTMFTGIQETVGVPKKK